MQCRNLGVAPDLNKAELLAMETARYTWPPYDVGSTAKRLLNPVKMYTDTIRDKSTNRGSKSQGEPIIKEVFWRIKDYPPRS